MDVRGVASLDLRPGTWDVIAMMAEAVGLDGQLMKERRRGLFRFFL